MAITQYYGTMMDKELGPGVLGEYPGIQADTKANGETGYILPGLAVQLVPGSPGAVELFDGTGVFYGIVTATKVGGDDYEELGYAANKPVPILRKGTLWVEVVEEVVAGDGAVIDEATSKFRPVNTDTVAVTPFNGQFKTSASAGELALLEVLLPGPSPAIEVLYTVTFGVSQGNGEISAAVGGFAIVTGAGVERGKDVVFTATPDSGYKVSDWLLNGVSTGTSELTYTVSGLGADTDVKVAFTTTV